MSEERHGSRIRDAFERALEPPEPGFEARMRSAVITPRSRQPRRWPLGVAAGALALIVVVALSLPHLLMRPPSPATEPGVVPWADVTAPDSARPFTRPGVRACPVASLAFEFNGTYINSGPANTSFWAVSVTNSGSTQCFVGPTLDIAFSTAQGPLKLTPQRWPGDLVYLVPGARAVGEIDTFPCHISGIAQMTISPGPGLGSVRVDPGPAGGWGVACPDRPQTYLVELTSDNPQGGYAPLTQTSMQAPAAARAGDIVRFLVTITNRPAPRFGIGPGPSPAPITFSPCPTYHVELEGVEGTFHTYRLNCAAAAPIADFGTETFEMFVEVPRDARPGPAVLVWSIDGSPQQWERASSYVPIEP